MSIREVDLRDQLASNLSQLEPGLELISVEYGLPSLRGAAGRVDILARDDTDMLVVIEVKASLKTTREALHEIVKYASLVAEAHGRGPEDVRCVLASTHWRELVQTFSELRSLWDYRVDGFDLEVDQDGVMVAARPVEVRSRAATLRICPEHLIFLFRGPEARDDHIGQLRRALLKRGVPDHVLLCMNHVGANPRVIYPFCIYLVIGALSSSADPDEPWAKEAEVFRWLLSAVPSLCVERGTPDTFRAMSGWEVIDTFGSGRFGDGRVWSDPSLRRRVIGEGLVVSTKYETTCRPADAARWRAVQVSALRVLEGNRPWSLALRACAANSESDPGAVVDLYVFDPQDVLLTMQCAQRDGFNYMPLFRYTHRGQRAASFEVQGTLVWTGRLTSDRWVDLLAGYGGSVSGYIAHRVCHDTSVGHRERLDVLGLEYRTIIGRDDRWATLGFDAQGRAVVTPLEPWALPADLLEHWPELGRWLDMEISSLVKYPGGS